MAEVRIGVSGWSYGHWRKGVFYPEGLPQRRELEYASRRFNSVEINGSFYSLLKPETYRRYREQAPDGFLFAVKGSQFITHSKKLKDVRVPLANFFASGLLRLEDALGPVLWQLPEMKWDRSRVAEFLDLLPKTTTAASRLAKKHDERVTGRASMVVHEDRPIRHALEIRHEHFFHEEVVAACREQGVALVFADSGDWRSTDEVTADFVYLRLHGSPHTYASDYDDARLDRWAERIRTWTEGGEPEDAERITARQPPTSRPRDAYVYFDNDGQGHAPHNALGLMERLAVEPLEPPPLSSLTRTRSPAPADRGPRGRSRSLPGSSSRPGPGSRGGGGAC